MTKKLDISSVAIIMDFSIPIILYRALQSSMTTVIWFAFGAVILIRVLVAAGYRKSA
jgi:hypothetical protein